VVPYGLGRNSMTLLVRFRGGASLDVSRYLSLKVLLCCYHMLGWFLYS